MRQKSDVGISSASCKPVGQAKEEKAHPGDGMGGVPSRSNSICSPKALLYVQATTTPQMQAHNSNDW
jgi:hypothetical protein